MRAVSLWLVVLLLVACDAPRKSIVGCAALGDLVPVCGFARPEDIELLPDGRTLLISQMGSPENDTPGAFALFDTQSETITRLAQFTEPAAETWGSETCTSPPGTAFAPHGTNLSRRADGHWQLLAVNHGGRESVEYFELIENTRGYLLQWRGCVVAPGGSALNDVVALPDGGFLVTHMYPRGAPSVSGLNLRILEGMLGFATGNVLHCDARECSEMPGTAVPLPIGIKLARNGDALFLNVYLSGEVRKISYPEGRLLGTVKLDAPLNSQWDAEGRLLVATRSGGLGVARACLGIVEGACPAAFSIVEIDPQTLESRTLFSHSGAPMGAASVAQQVGDSLYLGSYAGDRILRVPLGAISDPPRSP